jgi:hypothetical protein
MSLPAQRKAGDALAGLDQAIEARRLQRGQLVIVDEASLAGTFALDELVSAARDAGAKVLLVLDGQQPARGHQGAYRPRHQDDLRRSFGIQLPFGTRTSLRQCRVLGPFQS